MSKRSCLSLFSLPHFFFSGNQAYLSHRITPSKILHSSSTPIISPSYPFGPYRFINREFLIISYETDPEALRKVVPSPLKPSKENIVNYEWINMPDSYGFGSYSESGAVIPCEYNGESINFVLQMFLDNEPPIAAGREIWGFPKKFGKPKLFTKTDTLIGKLTYSGEEIAMGTMNYKFKKISEVEAKKSMAKKQCNFKLIPGPDGKKPDIAQLVSYNMEDIIIKEAWEGPARLNFRAHVNAPTFRLPIKRVLGGKHIIADMTLPYGKIFYDYLKHPEEYKNLDWSDKQHPSKLDFSRIPDLLKSRCMPILAPSYGAVSFQYKKLEQMIFRYKSDPESIARSIPEPLIPNENNEVFIIFTKTEATGLSEYNKCEMFVPVYFNGKYMFFGVQGYVDCSATRTVGREVYGVPAKFGYPKIETRKDTIVSTLKYNEEEIMMGTMTYHQKIMDKKEAEKILKVPIVHLKLIPSAEQGKVDIAQLIVVQHEDIVVDSAFCGETKIEMKEHVNAPMADLKVRENLEGFTIKAQMNLSHGEILHDYKKE